MNHDELLRVWREYWAKWRAVQSYPYHTWPKMPECLYDMTCGAKTRAGTPCKQRTIFASGRCKWHGGQSTGPKTEAGKEQMRINGRKGGRPKKVKPEP